ncbi:GNAT family N-acetyltransferase [Calothrix rhizosoleniae]|uniref:GNAT family N-acetyltransferase n=1 Tax=Calothrix rhizosoleniae TaxID=888997 RepID=UPI000B4A1E4A|nr:GNAT family N-acetyltransferase [Calothrix rhizosoleniae]
MKKYYQDFLIRNWQASDVHKEPPDGDVPKEPPNGDRIYAAEVIRSVLAEYGLGWEPEGADRDVLQVEECYLNVGGEFWVIEHQGKLVGTGAYYPVKRGHKAVEIRKMYLIPQVRGKGLGKYLLQQLEIAIAARGFEQIWIETASVLAEAVKLYESNGYQPATGVETTRCDLIYIKQL